MKYYLAIDIGASSGRHLLGWLEDGRLITKEIYRFSNGPTSTDHGLVWDTERLFGEILEGLAEAGRMGCAPCAIGIDTWGVDYVLLDAEDRVVGDTFCYRNQRTEAITDKVHEVMPFSELYGRTGIQFARFNSVYQLFCDKEAGRLDKASTFLMLPDYFNFRLTGVKKQEFTNATTTGMVNAETRAWDSDIIGSLAYPSALFGELTQPGTEVGCFTDAVAARVGYQAKVILPATHDTASAVLAAPLEGRAPYISSGTWSLLGVERDHAHTDAAAQSANYSNEGSLKGDVRLQKNIMGLWMIQQVRHETGDAYSFDELASMARSADVAVTLDVNDPRFLAPENMTQEISAAAGRELTLGETARVIYENLAASYAEAMAELEAITGEKYATLNIIGGGSKNRFLNELTAKYTGRKIITGPTEGTAIGNLMVQMIGMGDVADVAEGRKIVKRSFPIEELEETK